MPDGSTQFFIAHEIPYVEEQVQSWDCSFKGAASGVHALVTDFIEECAAFSNGAHDDQVDAMTQVLLRWHAPQEEQVFCYSERVIISEF
jgi:hypothetical protein